jgi:hypothetical protein
LVVDWRRLQVHNERSSGGHVKIGEIEKGADKIIVNVKDFKGKTYVDVRTYFENDQGEMIPTKKGISLNPDNVDEMIKLLQKAKKSLGERTEET